MKLKPILSILTATIILTSAIPTINISEVNALKISTLSEDTLEFYDYWKDKYLVQNPYTTETQYYVFYGDQTYVQAGYEVPVTVSEAHG